MQNNWAGLIAIGVFGTVFGYVTLWYARLALDRQRRPAREIIETTIREALTTAREEGRAAGYAEAIEKAAKICDEEIAHARQAMDMRVKQGLEIHGWQCRSTGAHDIQDFIRALTPAKEEP